MTYYSATATVLNALNKVKDEKGDETCREIPEGGYLSGMSWDKTF